jgi:hypothetical protein
MKQPVLVRFANDAHHSTIIDLDVTKLTDVMKFPKEIFGNIDGIRIAILREEYEQLIKDNGKEIN